MMNIPDFKFTKGGHTIEVPPPDSEDNGVVLFDGEVVMRVNYHDANGKIRLSDGRSFRNGTDFGKAIIVLAETLLKRRTM